MKNKTVMAVALPSLPAAGRSKSQQDTFWEKQSQSGAINAFRQLTSTRHRGGRRQVALPGGKLKPLFKNYSAPPRTDGANRYGGRQALPGIGSPSLAVGSQQHQVICGHTDNLPPFQPSAVRVYLASNFEDMQVEREHLLRHAVPELQTYCSKLGLHFQLVDLCWGAHNPHGIVGITKKLREMEIQDCQALSVGPAFVVLHGDKCGEDQIPMELSTEHYEMLSSLAKEKDLENNNLLESLYQLDENSIPPVYCLQVQTESADDVYSLAELMKTVLDEAVSAGKLEEDTAKEMTMSVLESDVNSGLFQTQNPRTNCLCYRREIQNLEAGLTSDEFAMYVPVQETEDGNPEIDIVKQSRNKKLAESISQHLGSGNYHAYYMKWPADQQSLIETKEFEAYLNNLTIDFVTDIKHLVVQGIEYQDKLSQSATFLEVLHHAHVCVEKAADFHGQESLLFRIEKFLKDPRQNFCPFIIHGPDSCGKSSVMATVARKLHEWFTPESVVVTRFLGTTSSSCHIHATINSITQQVCMAYGLKVPRTEPDMGTLFKALQRYRSVLELVSQEYASIRPLFILLDGLSSLHPILEQMHAMWAMRDMPPNTHLIVAMSTTLGGFNLVENVVSIVSDESACREIEPLDSEEVPSMIDSFMEARNRKLTDEQKNCLIELYNNGTSMLALKQGLIRALTWKSFTSVEDITLPASGTEAFLALLEALKARYGENLIKFLQAYITVSGLGILERELLDVLVCNQEVKNDMEKLADREVKTLYFPQLLWSVLKDNLKMFLRRNTLYGKSALSWKQQEYYAVIGENLGVIYPGISDDKITPDGTAMTLSMHEDLADRYSEKDTEIPGRIVTGEDDIGVDETIILISPQPTSYKNIVKLHRLPTHLYVLLPVQGLEEVKREIFFNLEWMKMAVRAYSVLHMIKEVQPTITLAQYFEEEEILEDPSGSEDLQILLQFLQLASSAIIADPSSVSAQVVGRLSGHEQNSEFIKQLVDKAKDDLELSEEVQLVPLYSCLSGPGCLTLQTLNGPTHLISLLHHGMLLLTFQEDQAVEMWKIGSGELLQRFPINNEQPLKGVIPTKNGDHVIIGYYSHLQHVMEMAAWSTSTGVALLKTSFPNQFESFCLDAEDKYLLTCTKVVDELSETTTFCLMGIDNRTREVIYSLPIEGIHAAGVSEMHHVQGIKGGLNGLVTVGAKPSNDLAYWDLEAEELMYSLELGCFIDNMKINTEERIAICSSAEAGKIFVVDLVKGEIRHSFEDAKLKGHKDIYLSNQGHHILVATLANSVLIYSVAKGTEVDKTIGHSVLENGDKVIPTKITMDLAECFLFVGYNTGVIGVYMLLDGSMIKWMDEHSSVINSLMYTPQGYLVTAAAEGCSKVLNVLPLMEEFLQGLDDSALAECDGQFQFSSTAELEKKKQDDDVEEHPVHPSDNEDINDFILSTDGSIAYTSSTDRISEWKTETATLNCAIDSSAGCSNLYSAYKGKMLVGHASIPGSTRCKVLKVWNESGGAVPMDDAVQVYTSCATQNGSQLFTIGPSSKTKKPGIMVGLYDLFEMKTISYMHCNIYGHMDCTNMSLLGETNIPIEDEYGPKGAEHFFVLDYFPKDDRSYFFSFSLHLPENEQSEPPVIKMDIHEPLRIDTHSPQCTTLLANGEVVSGTVDGSLVIWHAKSLSIITNLDDQALRKLSSQGKLKNPNMSGHPAHDGVISCVQQSPDKCLLVTGGQDTKVRVWDLKLRQLATVLAGHTAKVGCISFSSDSTHVLTGAIDGVIHVWKIDSGTRLASFHADGMVCGLAITPSADRVVARVKDRRSKLIILNTVNMAK